MHPYTIYQRSCLIIKCMLYDLHILIVFVTRFCILVFILPVYLLPVHICKTIHSKTASAVHGAKRLSQAIPQQGAGWSWQHFYSASAYSLLYVVSCVSYDRFHQSVRPSQSGIMSKQLQIDLRLCSVIKVIFNHFSCVCCRCADEYVRNILNRWSWPTSILDIIPIQPTTVCLLNTGMKLVANNVFKYFAHVTG